MKLHFPWTGIEQSLEEIKTATAAKPLYGQETGKGLWLVGDQGVYLMPNTTDGKHNRDRKENETLLVVYARECDPTALDFDAWWENKRSSFGADDGVDFLDLKTIEDLTSQPPKPSARPEYLVIDISLEQFSVGVVWRTLQ